MSIDICIYYSYFLTHLSFALKSARKKHLQLQRVPQDNSWMTFYLIAYFKEIYSGPCLEKGVIGAAVSHCAFVQFGKWNLLWVNRVRARAHSLASTPCPQSLARYFCTVNNLHNHTWQPQTSPLMLTGGMSHISKSFQYI